MKCKQCGKKHDGQHCPDCEPQLRAMSRIRRPAAPPSRRFTDRKKERARNACRGKQEDS